MIWADSRSNGDAEPRPYPKSSTLCWPWHVQISVSGYKNNNIYKPYSFCPRCAFLHCEHSWTIPKHPNSSIWDGTSTVITCKYLQQDSSDVKAKNPWPWWHWIPCWCSWLWACNLETLEKTRKELVAMKNMLKVQPVRDSSMRRLTSFRFRQVSAARGFLSSKTRSSQFWPNWVALGKSTSTRSKEVRHSKWRKILQYAFLAVSRVFGFGMLGILRTYAVAFWSQQADAGESYSAKIVMFGFLQFFFFKFVWLFAKLEALRWMESTGFVLPFLKNVCCCAVLECFGFWKVFGDFVEMTHCRKIMIQSLIFFYPFTRAEIRPEWESLFDDLQDEPQVSSLTVLDVRFFFSDTSSVLKCWHRRLGWIVGGALWPLGIFVRIYTYTSSAARGGAGSFKKVMYI